jgi:putative oxidoreductase
MDAPLRRFADITYALMRVIVGTLLACHGAQKLFGLLGGTRAELASLTGLAGVIEFFGGVLVALGLFAGLAAFLISGTMAVAYFKVHAPGGFWPILNHGELAVAYCFVFLYVSSHGSGAWSLDALMRRAHAPTR